MVSSLLLAWLGGAGFADASDRFAQETGLDVDLVNVMKLDVAGTELTIVFVFINERTFSSKISPALRATLTPYVGQNAIYVNPSVEPVVELFDFSPAAITASQDGSVIAPSMEAWIEITPGFLEGRFEVNPSGPSQGSGGEGVVILGEAVDSARPFTMGYRGETVSFEIGPRSVPPTYAAPDDRELPPEVAPLADVTTLEEVLTQEEFSEAAMAGLFSLDPALVRTIHLPHGGEDLRLLFVRLEESIRTSALGDALLETLDPFLGTGAVMVWAFTGTGATFSPWHIYVHQGTNWPVGLFSNPFVELTEGFSRSVILDPGQLVAGVFRLPSRVDPTAPFSIFYGTSRVTYP